MSVAAIVVAAGRGERLGADVPKALVAVAGRPLVVHAVAALRAAGIARIVVVHPPDAHATFDAVLVGTDVTTVAGGATRDASVRAGLAALDGEVTVVAVHDAARGLQPPEVIAAVVAAVTGDVVAAAPALPVTDTIKAVAGGEVVGTVDRSTLAAVQTPQAVAAELLRAAHHADAGTTHATDDLGRVEDHLAGTGTPGRVVVVPGSPLGTKVTYAPDVIALEALLAQR